MKTEIGAKEIRTQERLLKLFIDKLGYNYIGNWEDRQDNSNIEEKILRQYLVKLQKYSSFQINNAINKFRNAALNLNAGIMAANEEVYEKLRYGVTVDKDISKNKSKVFLIDWKNPIANNFSIAQEVSVKGANDKRPDLVIYVNGIALAVIELKRSTVSVHQGIRQNLDNQEPQFIPHFFTTIQLLFAGNDSEGLYYGVIKTPEKFWTRWKEINPNISNELDRSVLQMFDKNRLLEFIYDCIVFDGGIKKAARPHQYFALKAAQLRIKKKESGIIWHSQGTGKSLVMVWLANWIFENIADARILVITDRDELDKQIESAFKNVQEKPQRAVSGENLIKMLDKANPRLICALIHKFGAKDDNGGIKVGARKAEKSLEEYLDEVKKKLPDGFKAKGCIFVFIDECHRTQSGKLHSAMTEVLGKKIMMIGFTGTPLLKKDKKLSVEIFGSIIHSYKFDEAVADKVILDLRYEAREAPQFLGSKEKIDEWFEGKTQGLSNIAKNELKKRWAVMEKLFSSKDRMQRIAADICQDMDLKPVLSGKYGNAMLVADGIYQALRYWKFFQDTELKGHCAAVTSYDADINYIKDETTGSGETEEKQKYNIAREMMGAKTQKQFEDWAKEEFINRPADMRLLIVVDKLLTGFDAPSASYLYIDKKMQDHGLFQAICRVNRLDCEQKDFGYIVDYQDLFNAMTNAIGDYTAGAFENYDKKDIENLIKDKLKYGKKDLEDALQAVELLCETAGPQTRENFFKYFVCIEQADGGKQEAEIQDNALKREKLYKLVNTLLLRFIDFANDMIKAGYTKTEIASIKEKVDLYNALKDEIKLKSGDYIDLKFYEPAMRQLIDNYVRAQDSGVLLKIDNGMSLLDIVAECGADSLKGLPRGIKEKDKYIAETLIGNMRRNIVEKRPENPTYYDKLSKILNQLLLEQKEAKLSYKELIIKLIEQIKEMKNKQKNSYPKEIDTPAKQALYDKFNKNKEYVLWLYKVIKENALHGFRDLKVPTKMKRLQKAVTNVMEQSSAKYNYDVKEVVSEVMNIVINHREF